MARYLTIMGFVFVCEGAVWLVRRQTAATDAVATALLVQSIQATCGLMPQPSAIQKITAPITRNFRYGESADRVYTEIEIEALRYCGTHTD